jgi:hypothetical protein
MKKVIMVLMVIMALFLITGCKEIENEETSNEIVPEEIIVEEDVNEIVEEVIEEVKLCVSNDDCPEICLDGQCSSLAEQYPIKDCQVKCQLKEVTVITNENQEIVLTVNREGYTMAGAISWIVPRIEYCQGDNIKIPFQLKKKQFGKVVNEQYITVKEGQTSDVITHPGMEGVKLTFTIKETVEECQ